MDIDYRTYHRDKEYLDNESLFRNIFLKRYYLIRRFINKKGSVLDIGCTNGVFLDIFKEKGWKTLGIEPSVNGKIAREKGHEIKEGYFESLKITKRHFDLVILNHTLEHMDSPTSVLKKVNNILKDDGVIFVDVPNFGGLGSKILGRRWPYLLPDEHKHQFTKQELEMLFKNCGFKVLHFESRSGLFEFASPMSELWQSLIHFKKRFFVDLLLLPYSALATLLNRGDSMSMIGRKI